jgi:hypothetical protein
MAEHFIIAGAQRSGTTFLYHLLDRHPGVEMARPLRPEPKLFLAAEGVTRERYATLFAGKPGARWRGEKSTSYMERPEMLPRLLALLPECRVLFLLRDPVERAVSNYWFSVAHGVETLDIEEAFRREGERRDDYPRDRFSVSPFAYLARGEYARLLAPFLAGMPRDRLCFALFDRLLRSPAELAFILAFLGLPPDDAEWLLPAVDVANRSPRRRELPAGLRRLLVERYAEPNRVLAARLGLDLSPWSGVETPVGVVGGDR